MQCYSFPFDANYGYFLLSFSLFLCCSLSICMYISNSVKCLPLILLDSGTVLTAEGVLIEARIIYVVISVAQMLRSKVESLSNSNAEEMTIQPDQ